MRHRQGWPRRRFVLPAEVELHLRRRADSNGIARAVDREKLRGCRRTVEYRFALFLEFTTGRNGTQASVGQSGWNEVHTMRTDAHSAGKRPMRQNVSLRVKSTMNCPNGTGGRT
jgi:hypothetical protein